MKNILNIKFASSKHSIRFRLILLFCISTAIIFISAGYYLRWQIQSTLDHSLGQNLEKVAAAFTLEIDPHYLPHIKPGDEHTRTYHNLKNQLIKYQQVTGVTKIYLFDRKLCSIVDSDSIIRIGQLYSRLLINKHEIEQIFNGEGSSSVLFKGVNEKLYKTGYAPIMLDDEIIAGLAVEGSAEMLDAVTTIQKNMLWIGLMIIIASIIIGNVFAKKITTPIKKLENAASKISKGYLHLPIADCGEDEVGFLSKTMEQMRQNILLRDKRQQAMLAGVAHEIRNPLGGIELFAGLLANDVENAELKNYANKILKEVHILNSIIQNFLIFAKPTPANKIPCNIQIVFNDAISLLAAELSLIQIKFDQAENDFIVFVDPQHLKQIFLNLLQNSIQAMPKGGTIFVCMNNIVHNFIKISYSDSGPGIPDEYIDKIFEPFFTTKEKGTGLGLSIVKNMIEENSGFIQYIPDADKGINFVIELPIYNANDDLLRNSIIK